MRLSAMNMKTYFTKYNGIINGAEYKKIAGNKKVVEKDEKFKWFTKKVHCCTKTRFEWVKGALKIITAFRVFLKPIQLVYSHY